MKKLLSLLFIGFSLSALADSVRVYNPTNLVVTGLSSAIVTLNSETSSGDATAETAPARVFIPIQNNVNNTHLYSTLNVGSLFNIENAGHTVGFPLSVTTGGNSPNYVYAAVKVNGSYYFVAKRAVDANVTNAYFQFNLSPLDICKAINANGGNPSCENLLVTKDAKQVVKALVYFFISNSVLDISGTSTAPVTDHPDGVYFEAQMSNKVYEADDLKTFITDLKVGDRRLILSFNSNSTMDSTLFKKVVLFNYTDKSTEKAGDAIFGSLNGAGTLINRDVVTGQSGEYTLNNLVNDTPYNVALAFQDKFLFVTTFSNSRIGQPLEIQELLKKQSCYLLTAGFGEEHYVINYFRHYRDQVLAQSYVGRQFIKVYYRTAPHYAEMIYKSETLRLTIRILAYIMYFFFRFSWLIFIGLACWYILNLRKNKILMPKSDL